MKKLLIIVPFILLGITAVGQRLPWFLNRGTSHVNNIRLYIYYIPGKPPLKLLGYELNLNPNSIREINVTNKNEAMRLYGREGENGVINIYCKKNTKIKLTKLTNLTEILTKYKIDFKDRKLPVYIDSSFVNHPEIEYYNLSKIKSVKIDTEFVSDIRFINIITVDPPRKPIKPKQGEIWIRGITAGK